MGCRWRGSRGQGRWRSRRCRDHTPATPTQTAHTTITIDPLPLLPPARARLWGKLFEKAAAHKAAFDAPSLAAFLWAATAANVGHFKTIYDLEGAAARLMGSFTPGGGLELGGGGYALPSTPRPPRPHPPNPTQLHPHPPTHPPRAPNTPCLTICLVAAHPNPPCPPNPQHPPPT